MRNSAGIRHPDPSLNPHTGNGKIFCVQQVCTKGVDRLWSEALVHMERDMWRPFLILIILLLSSVHLQVSMHLKAVR